MARRAGFSAKIPAAGDERAARFAMRGILAATRMPCGGDRVAEPSTGRLHEGRCEGNQEHLYRRAEHPAKITYRNRSVRLSTRCPQHDQALDISRFAVQLNNGTRRRHSFRNQHRESTGFCLPSANHSAAYSRSASTNSIRGSRHSRLSTRSRRNPLVFSLVNGYPLQPQYRFPHSSMRVYPACAGVRS